VINSSLKSVKGWGASHFLAQGAALKYLNQGLFREADIQLEFLSRLL